jgi:hypothetical protein
MLYRPPAKSATSPQVSAAQTAAPSSAPTVLRVRVEAQKITGHTIARRVARMSKAQRALVAAELYKRGFDLQRPTIKQLAATVDVSAPYVHAALKLNGTERARVNRGPRPLLEPKPTHPALPIPKALAEAWTSASADERAAFVSSVGVGAVWDVMERVIA